MKPQLKIKQIIQNENICHLLLEKIFSRAFFVNSERFENPPITSTY